MERTDDYPIYPPVSPCDILEIKEIDCERTKELILDISKPGVFELYAYAPNVPDLHEQPILHLVLPLVNSADNE